MKTGTHTQVPVPMTIACPHDYGPHDYGGFNFLR